MASTPPTLNCNTIANVATRFWHEDLDELSRYSLRSLLNAFDRVSRDQQAFKEKCFYELSKELYDHYESYFSIALLKLAVAIEDKAVKEGAADGDLRRITSMFSNDEKNFIREFERFKSLDPEVLSPELLADYIVSKRSGIYELVKEAVNNQYINFDKLIESWSSKYALSNPVRKGLLIRYRARFQNIIDAVKMLLDQQPAWIRRLFSDYEDALLSSSKVREMFEKEMGDVFKNRLNELRSNVERLEKEREGLLGRLEDLLSRATKAEAEREALRGALERAQHELSNLRARYEEALKGWEEWLSKLDSLREKLFEKEEELKEMARREEENIAAKEALEAEISRLKQLVSNYEAKVRGYEAEKGELLLKLSLAEEKANLVEKSLRGEGGGRPINSEEAALLETIFIGKLRSKLSELPLTIRTPWGDEKVSRWDTVKIYYESSNGSANMPKNARVIFKHERHGFLGLGEARRVEVRGVYVSDLNSLKENGLEAKPASLSELISVVKEIPLVRGEGKTFTIIGIASPTGWSEEAIKHVVGKGAPTLLTKDMVVFLVDPIEGKVYYPEGLSGVSQHIEDYARFFTPEIDVEEEARAEKAIEDLCDRAKAESPIEPAFPYSDLYSEAKSVPKVSLIRALHRLMERGVIEVKGGVKERLIVCRNYMVR